MTILGFDNKELDAAESTVKMRCLKTFRKPGQKITELNEEFNALQPADLEWFAREFTAAGYPTKVA